MIVNMKRLTLVAHKKDEQAILHVIQPLEAIEVLPSADAAVESAQLSIAEERVQVLGDTLELLKPYGPKKGLLTAKRESTLSGISNAVPSALKQSEYIDSLQREISRIRSEMEKNTSLVDMLRPWTAFPSCMDACKNSSHVTYFSGLLAVSDLEKLSQQEFPIDYQVFESSTADMMTAVLVACAPGDAKSVFSYLKTLEWTEFVFPELHETPQAAMDRLMKENETLLQEQNELVAQLAQKGDVKHSIEAAYDAAVIERDRLSAMASLRETVATFELDGWVREDRLSDVESAIQSVTDAYVLYARDPEESEVPPVVVQNSAFVEPFESVTNLYSPPDPRGIDATPLMTPFYILMFGMMLSDTGYGILLSIGCWLFYKIRKPDGMMGGITKVLFWGGLSTIVWGFLTGTFFGLDFDLVFGTTDLFPLMLDPMTEPIPMLLLCFAMGVVHIIYGMILKIKLSFGAGDWQTAIFDNLSWIFVIVGLILYAGASVVADIPALIGTIGLVMAIAGAVTILVFKGRDKKNILSRTVSGLGELYQVTSFLSDILSYARLFALGIATGVIASVFNQLCMMLVGSPNPILKVLGFVVAAVLLAGLHLFNIAINTLGTFVHCARLQYVEFYGKFYEAGGKLFNPLRYTTKHVRLNREK